ncbi:MAG: hypothetical protein XD78_0783 [Desulfotomaculum sp. 46_296]|nr:MAG: hypothetical protein XD78_0783 [Desulfotomaculum sp. 46_296]
MNVRPLPPQGSALAKLSYAPVYKNFSLSEDNCQGIENNVQLAPLYSKIFIGFSRNYYLLFFISDLAILLMKRFLIKFLPLPRCPLKTKEACSWVKGAEA